MKKPIPGALSILRYGLPFVALELTYIAVRLSNLSAYELAKSRLYAAAELEHVMMGLLLLVGGAMLFDLASRERDGSV